MKRTITIIIIGIATLASASAIKSYLDKKALQNEYHTLKEISSVANVNTKFITSKVKVYEKAEAGKKLNLPERIMADKNVEILTTGVVDPYEGKTDVVATLNTETGESKLDAKQRPLPFMALLSEKEYGARLGIQTDGRLGADVHARWTLGRVGKARMALYGELATSARQSNLNEAKSDIRGRLMMEVYTR